MTINNKEIPNLKHPNRNFFVVSLIFTLLYLSSFKEQDSPKPFHFQGLAQGTTYHISYYAERQSVSQNQIDSILTEIDHSLSIYSDKSLITAFNKSAGGVKMDQHFKAVVSRSLDISDQSEGAFDITVYPLVDAWGFGLSKRSSLPDSAQISNILENVGYHHLQIQGDWLLKDKAAVKIDVNGIAQGYSVDVIADFLESNNIYNYMVELGGELRVKGRKNSRKKFKIGIEGVNASDLVPLTKYIEIDHGAITTSGNYRKFYESGNQKVSHLIDTKSGRYLQNDLISVTVFAKDAMTADGYDNVLMSLGLAKAMRFLANEKAISAYFVYTENGMIRDTCSAGFPQIRQF